MLAPSPEGLAPNSTGSTQLIIQVPSQTNEHRTGTSLLIEAHLSAKIRNALWVLCWQGRSWRTGQVEIGKCFLEFLPYRLT